MAFDHPSLGTNLKYVLNAYEQKPECFKKAARALRQGCKNIDMDEDEKTRYAIRLAACEIATAEMPMPIECQQVSAAEPEHGHGIAAHEIGRCVQSLGRVPQLWTSYSGYFREVKVMCLVVRYSMEHEDLRTLQKNLTQFHADQIALLRLQRKELVETQRVETERLEQIMNMQSTLSMEMHSILITTAALRDSLSSIFGDLSKMTRYSEEGITQQSVALSNIRDMNEQLAMEYQTNLQESKVMDVNKGLDATVSSIHQVEGLMHEFTHSVSDRTKSMIGLVESDASGFHERVSAMLAATVSDIQVMAAESQIKMGELNRVVDEFGAKHNDVLRILSTAFLAGTFVTDIVQDRLPVMKLALPYIILGCLILRNGVMTAVLIVIMAAIIALVCDAFQFPVSFTNLLVGISFARIFLCFFKLRHLANFTPQEHIEQKARTQQNEHQLFAVKMDLEDDEIESDVPPPYYITTDRNVITPDTMAAHGPTTMDSARMMPNDLNTDDFADGFEYLDSSYNLSFESCMSSFDL
ncbi:hypothetical protein BG011_008511 [Mortierella polycephala]|uniref:Karyogamy protein 5 n=1 Tax=Mortierella polycephala TaxID=41804 RepID=A0A9P6TWJ9_9FUNG|nr:hypothetical protein BG011_008511 [Mortierella polycephala]